MFEKKGRSPHPKSPDQQPTSTPNSQANRLDPLASHSQSATQATILQLQRTIGNHAVSQMLAQSKVSVQANDLPTIQRLPTYREFAKGAKKFAKIGESTFTTTPGEKALKAGHFDPSKVAVGLFDKDGNIQKAYLAYDADPSLDNMIHLYDSITYWEALNNANAGEKWFRDAKYYLAVVKDQIQAEVKLETKKQYGTERDLATLEEETKVRENQDQQWSALMPPFMKDIGVAPRYYGKHLHNYPERKEGLKNFFYALEAGKLKEALAIYTTISTVPGMYLIKPLIVAHFAGNAELGNLVGTASQGPGTLTQQEKAAIRLYSTGAFVAMNTQLRETLAPPSEEAPLDLETFDTFLGAVEAAVGRKSTMELAVSGMNKLPPYKGIAYRGLVWQPGGYFDVIQPGAMIIDLAFQSASPSLKGVEHFLSTQTGTKHVYFMIHTKTAVNIMGYSDSVQEGEILFKPGAHFRVRAVWHHVGGKVPPNAPAEAQMILHSRGEFKTGGKQDDTGKLLGSAFATGLTEKDLNSPSNAAFLKTDQIQSMRWFQVKVIEMDEV